MRILLTGGGGMVGRNILEHPGAQAHAWLAPSSSELDLCDRPAVEAYVANARPEMVIHAAGKVGGIQANMAEPVAFLLRNLDMGRNIVMAARMAGVRRLINLGSSCMYPRGHQEPLREAQVLSGELEPTNEGYAIAKVAVARLCQFIGREDPAFAYRTLIPCNLYGRWDKFDSRHSHMVPSVIRKLHDAKRDSVSEVAIWGDGSARREFMYAGDLADAILRACDLVHYDRLPPLMNVGIGSDHSIDEYYHVVAEVVGYHGTFVHDTSKPTGMQRKLVDIGLQVAWGWAPRTSLAEGIQLTHQFLLAQESA